MEDHLDAFDDLLGTGLEPAETEPVADFGTDPFALDAGLQPFDDVALDVHDVAADELDTAVLDPVEDDPVAASGPAPAPAPDDDDPWSAAFLT